MDATCQYPTLTAHLAVKIFEEPKELKVTPYRICAMNKYSIQPSAVCDSSTITWKSNSVLPYAETATLLSLAR